MTRTQLDLLIEYVRRAAAIAAGEAVHQQPANDSYDRLEAIVAELEESCGDE